MNNYLDENKKEKNNEMGKYLIIRFLIVIVFIYASSHILNILMQRLLMPVLSDSVFASSISLDSNPIISGLKILGYLVVSMFVGRIPGPLSDIVQRLVLGSPKSIVVVPEDVLQSGRFAISFYYITLIVLALLLLVITVLPYVIGCGWFTYEIWRKVKDLIEEDRRKKEEYEKQRNLLLSDIAHDIKTPITAMSGYAKAMNDGLVPEEKKSEYLSSIYSKSMRVSELIDMMFEYIKLDSAEYKLDIKPYDIAELTREVIASSYQDFEDAGLVLDIEIPEEEMKLDIDKTQMSRVVNNLLSNALKYTQSGDRVLLKVESEKESYLGFQYRITVADSGLPIDEEFAEHIFEPFAREDKVRSTQGGTGLGLSIAHKIVSIHGGELALNTKYGSGYTKAFIIRI